MLGDLLIKPHLPAHHQVPCCSRLCSKRTPKPQAQEALTAMVGPSRTDPCGRGGLSGAGVWGAAPGNLAVFLERLCPCGR